MKTQKKTTLIQKFKMYVSNLFYKYIKEPKQKRKKLAENILAKQKEKTLFEEKYKTNYDEALRLMNFKMGTDSKFEYWDDKLVEGRKHVNEFSKYKAPSFYDPEICDIHNENLDNPSLINYHTLILSDTFNAANNINKQAKALNAYDNDAKLKENLKKIEHKKYLKAQEEMAKANLLENNDPIVYTKFNTPESKIDTTEIKMLKTTISEIKNR